MNEYRRNLMRLRGFCDGAGAKGIRKELEEDEDYMTGYMHGQKAKREYAEKSAKELGVTIREIIPL